MSDELKAAAEALSGHAWLERFRKADYGKHHAYSRLSPDACNEIAHYVDRFIMQVLARLAADEAERGEREKPIDGEWLRALKCGAWLDDFKTWYVEDEGRIGSRRRYGIGRLIEYCDGPDYWFFLGERIWRDSCPTRGQLLDLLRALKGGDA